MKTILVLIAAVAFAPSAVKVTKQANPKALILEVEVPAMTTAVWNAFTTSEGLSTWLTPGAVVDLRPGGEWTAHYPGGKTGGGTIVSFVKDREVVMRAMAPESFPAVRAERTLAKFEFESRGSSTVVRLTQSGWKSGEEWDRAYDYLASGNAQLLGMFRQRFISGPTDWEKIFGGKK